MSRHPRLCRNIWYLGPNALQRVPVGTSGDIPRQMGMSLELGHPGRLRGPGTLGNVLGETGQDIPGYPRISQGHLGPGTLDNVLGGTGQDIPGYPRISQGHLGPGTLGNVLGGTG